MQTDKQVLTADATTSIIVADKRVHESAVVQYSCRRGASAQAGKLTITNKVTSVDVDTQYTGDDIGLTFSGSFSGNNILLDAALDSSANDVHFNYILTKINVS